MYDARKIVPGLLVFLLIATFPAWYSLSSGAAASRADPVLATQEKECVESAEFMRAFHMQLLDSWRDEVVRGGKVEYVSTSGKRHEMSLTGGCMSCHSNKEQFCDSCHGYAQVNVGCWSCHTAGGEKKAI